MNWTNIQILKQSAISTIICLIGCSIGVIGVAFYFINYSWLFVLLASLIAGLISCMVFMIIWEMVFHKMNFKDAVKHGYKMSIVPILIMIISENIIMLYIVPKFSSYQMNMTTAYNFKIMLLAMGFGFLLSLPYSYYQLQKTGKAHH